MNFTWRGAQPILRPRSCTAAHLGLPPTARGLTACLPDLCVSPARCDAAKYVALLVVHSP